MLFGQFTRETYHFVVKDQSHQNSSNEGSQNKYALHAAILSYPVVTATSFPGSLAGRSSVEGREDNKLLKSELSA